MCIRDSIRGACAIGEAELKKLNTFYARYHIEMDRFVLPDGCIGASHLHVLRAEVKAVIRIMHQIQCEGKPVEAILFDFMNLLSNTFFMMCLYENAQDGIRAVSYTHLHFALLAKSGSHRLARPIMHISAFPLAMSSSAIQGSVIRPTVATGIFTCFFIS